LVNKPEGQDVNESACPNPEVITLNGSSAELPILIIFINSLLHLQSSKWMMDKLDFSSQFHQLLSHFAELGRGSRVYLLKCKTLGRLLDTFLHKQITNEEQVLLLQSLVPIILIKKNQMYLRPNSLVNADGKISRKEKLDNF